MEIPTWEETYPKTLQVCKMICDIKGGNPEEAALKVMGKMVKEGRSLPKQSGENRE